MVKPGSQTSLLAFPSTFPAPGLPYTPGSPLAQAPVVVHGPGVAEIVALVLGAQHWHSTFGKQSCK